MDGCTSRGDNDPPVTVPTFTPDDFRVAQEEDASVCKVMTSRRRGQNLHDKEKDNQQGVLFVLSACLFVLLVVCWCSVFPGVLLQLRVSWRAAPASCLLERHPSFVSSGGPPLLPGLRSVVGYTVSTTTTTTTTANNDNVCNSLCLFLAVMASYPVLTFLVFFSAALSSTCDGGKVLVYPVDGSHWLNMKILLELLHSRGHEITVIRSSTSWYISEVSPYYTSITIAQDHSHHIKGQDFMTSFLKRSIEIRRREENVISHIMLVYMHYFVVNPPYQAVCDKYFGADVNVMSLMQGADLWLIRTDFIFEFPRPTMPNVVYIGGFQGKPSKPLPADLEDFMQSSGEHGVVVMSLGTLLGDLGPELSEIIASAFANLPQKVVWRHIGERPTSLGNNTMLVKWLPQNDILGHPKTKLFMSRGGTNGIYEAIYHGVPILGLPLIFDQIDNFVRMKARGAAEMVDVTTLDVESLTNTLKNILDPTKAYKEKIQKLSQLHHDKPMKPIDSALSWMEFVMRHKGASHLRTESYKLPWYAYHCLDVMAVFAACGLILMSLVWVSCRCVIRALIRATKSKKE
ncbi:UDP-glucuronosyltransferase 2B20 [Takifugu flavidus]|uniref:UDP-glucuronosyltransferase 2B20 n=1 Tax=Takifugu flavidus TaxID=433684 RepID=A0A5C6MSP7_9TELE|nr:UDP-glucuronosyltransferase 2B20 [Takifugu flavidus]